MVTAAGQPLDVGSRAKLALNRERLALLRKQAPAFIILDFRCGRDLPVHGQCD
jgi:hypothetical protein